MTNFFVTTPICCPSRAEFFSGRYLSNLLATNEGPENCMQANTSWVGSANNGMFGILKNAGYEVGVFGKVTNNQGAVYADFTKYKSVSYYDSPVKFDDYYCLDYVHYKEGNGSEWSETIDKAHPVYGTPYQTPQLGNRSFEWLDTVAGPKPFFLYIGSHAPHYPAAPAPWYENAWPELRAPRTPNYNASSPDKTAHIRQNPPMDDRIACWEDEHMRDRWRALLSVDDLVRDLTQKLRDLKVMDNTYFIYTSDHGYKLGQWRIPTSKQHPYETDIRIPFMIRGPGIQAGSEPAGMYGNVDLLPTMLDLAGIAVPDTVDGRSFAPALLGREEGAWRDSLLIGYKASQQLDSSHSQIWSPPGFSQKCGGDLPNSPQGTLPKCVEGEGQCWLIDSAESNLWRALRTLNATHNTQYIEYDAEFTFDKVDFHEYYDITADPYQMRNLYPSLSDENKASLHQAISKYWACQGATCP
eukprot:TRINITY_DN1622_c0_g1_i1.p1 TRINITY_DN1622_c0_g1~~TRINITY_DN1622_c0_g1_i1.p1  ORF type:complete len:469 (+),score=121.22 TRINITY_DN1622_c0_g1_i1:1-1407(+)